MNQPNKYPQHPLRKVVIIGSGNLAETLARAISESDLQLISIVARNGQRAKEIAQKTATNWSQDFNSIPEADIYLISVSDRAVGEVAERLHLSPHAVVAHTAGAVALETIPERFEQRAVFYPLQTFTKGRSLNFEEIPLFIETSSEEVRIRVEEFAHHLVKKVYYADSEKRGRIHLAGVFANNFSNCMYHLGEEVMRSIGLDFEVLKPLIRETAAKACDAKSPTDVQTGPAVRGDKPTLERHCGIMGENEEMKDIYLKISQIIWETSKKI